MNDPNPSKRRRSVRLAASALVLALAAGAWFGWRWWTTPALPEVTLAGRDPDVADAISAALAEVRQAPREAAAWGRLGLLLRAHAELSAADHCFAAAGRLDPTDPRWPYLLGTRRVLGDPEGGLPLLRRARELCSGSEPFADAVRLRLAETLLEQGHLVEAEEHYRALSTRPQQAPRINYGLGLLAKAQGDLKESRRRLAEAAASPFARNKASGQLAALCLQLGDDAAAQRWHKAAEEAPPDLPWPDPLLALLAQNEVGRQSRLGQMEQLQRQGRPREALRVLRDVVRDYPDAHSFVTLGIELSKLGDFVEAEQVLRQTVALAPDKVQAHYYLALVLTTRADKLASQPEQQEAARALWREAVEDAGRALALQSDHAFALLYRGLAHHRLGHTTAALADLRKAAAARPEFVDPHLHLGEVLAAAGQRTEALERLRIAVRQSAPGDERAQRALDALQAKNP